MASFRPLPPRHHSPSRAWHWLPLFALSCTQILDIDGDYELASTRGGQKGDAGSTGGRPGSGGGSPSEGSGGTSMNTGGTVATGGSTASCQDAMDCGADMKCCGGLCVPPSPAVGCSLDDCTACPEPIANAEALCLDGRCSARCRDGYVPATGGCVPEGMGGFPGTGGTPGTGGESTGGDGGGGPTDCTPRSCPPCLNPAAGPVACCDQFTNECGCSWFSFVYCVN